MKVPVFFLLLVTALAGAPPPGSPLPSKHPLVVEFERTETNGTPMDKALFGFDLEVPCLWWQWESPENGWYAIDRPDEPDGGSDEFPQAFVFGAGDDGALIQRSEPAAWNWYRAAWFWAPMGDRFAIAVAARPGVGRWRLVRLATHPIPPGEESLLIPSAPGVLVTWKLTRARLGREDEAREEVRKYDDSTQWRFRESPLPQRFPPGFGGDFRWSWDAPRTGLFELLEPPDGTITLENSDEDAPRTLSIGVTENRIQVAAQAGQRLNFSLHSTRLDAEATVELRELSLPTHSTPDTALLLEGTSGRIVALHPDALGPADSPPGTFHPDRWPLWWKFVAPTDGQFTMQHVHANARTYTDLRNTPFTLTGRIVVCFPDPKSIVATLNDPPLADFEPQSWPLVSGETLWIRASAPTIQFNWSWSGE